jgi:hypothetical protein
MIRAPASGLLACVPLAQCHEAGHLVLGEANLLASPVSELEVRHFVRRACGLGRGLERVHLLE